MLARFVRRFCLLSPVLFLLVCMFCFDIRLSGNDFLPRMGGRCIQPGPRERQALAAPAPFFHAFTCATLRCGTYSKVLRGRLNILDQILSRVLKSTRVLEVLEGTGMYSRVLESTRGYWKVLRGTGSTRGCWKIFEGTGKYSTQDTGNYSRVLEDAR